jgi:hypothetical protein
VLWVLSVFFGGLGLLLYAVMAIIVPIEPEGELTTGDPAGEASVASRTGWHSPPAPHRHASRDHGRLVTFFGIALILFGGLALVDAFLPAWADGGRFLWPAFILGVGIVLVLMSTRRRQSEL